MASRKVLIIGAGGIVGQHMVMHQPRGVDATYTRRSSDDVYAGFDQERDDIEDFLNQLKPDAVINLSGENRVDIVERTPESFLEINVNFPRKIAAWADANNSYFIQCSTQGIFCGESSPYTPDSTPRPITQYGMQNYAAETAVLESHRTEVARLTFVLGVRPFQKIGRKNPLEDMLEKDRQSQVDDRFFSPLFAHDAARILWERALAANANPERIVHLGNPIECSRFSIASDLKGLSDELIINDVIPVSHESFAGIAQRPRNTAWKAGTCLYKESYEDGLITALADWRRKAALHQGSSS